MILVNVLLGFSQFFEPTTVVHDMYTHKIQLTALIYNRVKAKLFSLFQRRQPKLKLPNKILNTASTSLTGHALSLQKAFACIMDLCLHFKQSH